jgi:hypothetical protein
MRTRALAGAPPLRDPAVLCIPCTRARTNDDDDDDDAAPVGEIVVTPPVGAVLPVRATWLGVAGGAATISDDTLRVSGLAPGIYSVSVRDARGCASGAVCVRLDGPCRPHAPRARIRGYEVSEDGRRVRAICTGVESTDAVFVWSNGERTHGPILRAARPGEYRAWIVEDANGRRVTCTHAACAAAVVAHDDGTHAMRDRATSTRGESRPHRAPPLVLAKKSHRDRDGVW